jgi:hypothetical protein
MIVQRQLLGRLPWFAAFLRRERRLRPVLLMRSSQVWCLVSLSNRTLWAVIEARKQPSGGSRTGLRCR